MRRSLVAIAVMLFAVGAFAEEAGAKRVTIYASNLSIINSDSSGTLIRGGVGVGFSYFLSPRFSMELSYGMDKSHDHVDTIEGEFLRRETVRAYPLDFIAAWHIPTRSDWKPYLGAGARYVRTPGNVMPNHYNQLQPEIAFGSSVNMTPRLAFRFDGKYIPLGDVPPWSEPLKVSVGVSWRF